MKHIIIEGPDGAGKTQLARLLCRRHVMAYHHEGPPPVGTDAFEHYSGLLRKAGSPTVFDRFHLGEVIYGPLLRGGSGLSVDKVQVLNLQAHVILCLPPWETCFHNTRGRREMIKDERILRVAYDLWELLSKNYELTAGVQFYDYTSQRGIDVTF